MSSKSPSTPSTKSHTTAPSSPQQQDASSSSSQQPPPPPPKFSPGQRLIAFSNGGYHQVVVKSIAYVVSKPEQENEDASQLQNDQYNVEELTNTQVKSWKRIYEEYQQNLEASRPASEDNDPSVEVSNDTQTTTKPIEFLYNVRYKDSVPSTSGRTKTSTQWQTEETLFEKKKDIIEMDKELHRINSGDYFTRAGKDIFANRLPGHFSREEAEPVWHLPITPFLKQCLIEEYDVPREYKLPAARNMENICDDFLKERLEHAERHHIINSSEDLFSYDVRAKEQELKTMLKKEKTDASEKEASSANEEKKAKRNQKETHSSTTQPSLTVHAKPSFPPLPIYLSDSEIAQEIVDQLIYYFDCCCNDTYILFYHETDVHDEMPEEEAPCNFYGVEHLARFMAVLPRILSDPLLDDLEMETIKSIEVICGDLMLFMERNWSKYSNSYSKVKKLEEKKKKSKNTPSKQKSATPQPKKSSKKRKRSETPAKSEQKQDEEKAEGKDDTPKTYSKKSKKKRRRKKV